MTIDIKHLGLVSYDAAMELMGELHQKRHAGLIGDTILVLEHEPVITKGRRLRGQPVSLHPELERRGVTIREADRGGLLTYHGPGQIVVYFIVRFADHFASVTHMVERIESVLIAFLKKQDVQAKTIPGHPGIWVGDKKIASIGLRVSKGVTTHGIALNIKNDLDVYRFFDPCGLPGATMTNLEQLLGLYCDEAKLKELSRDLALLFSKTLS